MEHEQSLGHPIGQGLENQDERRTDARHLAVYRIARVRRADDEGLWRVKNMSDRGMLLESSVAVVPNEKLEIALSETIFLNGRVIWSGDGKLGVSFDKPVCASEILRGLVDERELESYRPLQLQVRLPAKLMVGAEERDIVVTSISQSDVCFAYEGELREAAKVDLALTDGIWRNGNIRWLRGGNAGLGLASAFALSELESVRGLI